MTLTHNSHFPCNKIPLQSTASPSYYAYYYNEVEYCDSSRTHTSSYRHRSGYEKPRAYEDENPRQSYYSYRYQGYWQPQHDRREQTGHLSTSVQGYHPRERSYSHRSDTFGSADVSSPDPSSWLPDNLIPPPPLEVSAASITPIKKSGPGDLPKEDASVERKPVNLILELRDHDIVCGRGAPVNWQKGNHFFREIIAEHQTNYLCSKRCDKPKVATEVMELIKSNGGRFVKRVKASYQGRFGWEEISEKRAYEKVCQALREGAPELRRKMLVSSGQLRRQPDNLPVAPDKENHNTEDDHRT